MYPIHKHIANIGFEQLWLFPQMAPNGHCRKVGKPARVFSRKARIAVMLIRQRLGKPLKHPDDLWNDERLVDRLAEKAEGHRNGPNRVDNLSPAAKFVGLENDAVDDTFFQSVLAEEQKVLAALETVLLLESLEAAQKQLLKQLKTLDTTTTGQLLYTRAKVKEALRGG